MQIEEINKAMDGLQIAFEILAKENGKNYLYRRRWNKLRRECRRRGEAWLCVLDLMAEIQRKIK